MKWHLIVLASFKVLLIAAEYEMYERMLGDIFENVEEVHTENNMFVSVPKLIPCGMNGVCMDGPTCGAYQSAESEENARDRHKLCGGSQVCCRKPELIEDDAEPKHDSDENSRIETIVQAKLNMINEYINKPKPCGLKKVCVQKSFCRNDINDDDEKSKKDILDYRFNSFRMCKDSEICCKNSNVINYETESNESGYPKTSITKIDNETQTTKLVSNSNENSKTLTTLTTERIINISGNPKSNVLQENIDSTPNPTTAVDNYGNGRTCGLNKICVPRYLCRDDKVNIYGKGVLDIRSSARCAHLEICCEVNNTIKDSLQPKEGKDNESTIASESETHTNDSTDNFDDNTETSTTVSEDESRINDSIYNPTTAVDNYGNGRTCGLNRVCVPRYLCRDDKVNIYGKGVLDIRSSARCAHLEICCEVNNTIKDSLQPKEGKDNESTTANESETDDNTETSTTVSEDEIRTNDSTDNSDDKPATPVEECNWLCKSKKWVKNKVDSIANIFIPKLSTPQIHTTESINSSYDNRKNPTTVSENETHTTESIDNSDVKSVTPVAECNWWCQTKKYILP